MKDGSRTKTEKVRGMNASLSLPSAMAVPPPSALPPPISSRPLVLPSANGHPPLVAPGPLSERDPGRLHITRRQIAFALALAVLAGVAAIFTVNAASSGDTSFPAVVSTSKVYDLNFSNTGKVVAISVSPGMHVTTGQVLASQDTGTLQAQLTADNEVVSADQVALQQAGAPQLTAQQLQQDSLQVQQQQTALANAQAALTAADQSGQANVGAAEAAVTSGQALVESDYTRYTQACPNGPVPPTSGSAQDEAAYTHCQDLQSAYDDDQATLTKAQSQVPVVQAQAQEAVNTAEAAVNTAQSALNLAQYQGTLQGSPSNSAVQAQAQAALNQAEAQQEQVQQELVAASIVAPASGIVAEVNGAAGENLGPTGVPVYKAPASLPSNQPSGFSLFPSQPTPSGSSDSSGVEPLIEIVGGDQQVTAQVTESGIGHFAVGHTASVTFSVLNGTYTGVVSEVVLNPTSDNTAVTYQVIVRLSRTVPSLLPGMSATVRT